MDLQRLLYLSAESAERIERELEEAREQGLTEYQELKGLLLRRTWRFGTLFALYLLLAASAEAAFCELVGAGASYGYLLLLFKDVDALQPGDTVYLREAETVKPEMMRSVAKWLASYRHALKPRLLVLVGLVAGMAAYNAAFPEQPLSLVEEGCLVAGFLSYKVALLQKVYDDLKPRAMTADQLLQQPRPMLPEVEDVEVPWKAKKKDGSAEGGMDDSSSVPAAIDNSSSSSRNRVPSSTGKSSSDEAGSEGVAGRGTAGQLQG
ncbi:hypothetical protein N2152v2_010752 [Parachlorella kessleri]